MRKFDTMICYKYNDVMCVKFMRINKCMYACNTVVSSM